MAARARGREAEDDGVDELAREHRGVDRLLACQRVREHLVAAGADEDRRDDVGIGALVDAPELLLGVDVRGGGPEDGVGKVTG